MSPHKPRLWWCRTHQCLDGQCGVIGWHDVEPLKVWRCRWCGRRVSGVWGWFHKPDQCERKPSRCKHGYLVEGDELTAECAAREVS